MCSASGVVLDFGVPCPLIPVISSGSWGVCVLIVSNAWFLFAGWAYCAERFILQGRPGECRGSA